jgi:PAS domain-containing protein
MDSPDLPSTTQTAVALRDLGERVLKSAPVIILLLDPGGIIQFVNPHFSRVTGYSPGCRSWIPDTFLRDHAASCRTAS